MRRFIVFLCLAVLVCFSPRFLTLLPAQEEAGLDWDIDSIFDEPPEEETPLEEEESEDAAKAAGGGAAGGVTVGQLMKRTGFTFDLSYGFTAGVTPGWREVLWSDVPDHGYYLNRFFKLFSKVSLDARISNVFRARSSVSFEIPFYGFVLGDIFFDYNFFDTVFVRAGKYGLSWGISPNYGFTNLLARVPKDGYAGDSYILKADIPLGIGGFQALAMTRANLMYNTPLIEKEEFGYGGKYNLALRGADLDMGLFYRDGMVLRGFLSLKTTLWNTELYTEGLFAIDVEEPSNISGAGNFGFARDFFGGRFNINGEFFYNAEKDVYFYRPETDIREAGKSPFIEGPNIALNLSYKLFEGKGGDLRFFMRALYAPLEASARLVPGFRLNPLPNIELSLAMPMTLGSKDGFYYKNTPTFDKDGKPIPFSVVFLLTLQGSVQAEYYR